jgi:hypothetical protein
MPEQMNLGELIDALKRKDRETSVYYDFVHFRPCGIHSYRGYYDQLAIGYDDSKDTSVGELLDMLKDADGKTFTGYKGGDYVMSLSTPVWVANHNESGGTAIVDVIDQDWRILLVTASVD